MSRRDNQRPREAIVIGLVAFVILCVVAVGAVKHVTPPPISAHPTRAECLSCHASLTSAPHPGHPALACASCHGEDAHAMLAGIDRALACTRCHEPMQELAQAPELAHARDAFFSSGCGSCHAVEGALRRLRPGPDLREARIKLTREWTYRFLTEPYAWNPALPPGPHHLSPEKDGATFVAKARAVVTALCGNHDRLAQPLRAPDKAAAALLSAGKCRSCHALDRLGAKVSRAWLEAFLRAPRTHAQNTLHLDPHWSEAQVTLVADALLAGHDPLFEPRWPVLDRATVDATDALLGEELPSGTQPRREALLGARVIENEGCGGCHALLGPRASGGDLSLGRQTRSAHVAKFAAAPESAMVFVRALRRYAQSDAWPKAELPSVEGGALVTESGCLRCHTAADLRRPRSQLDWQRALADRTHDFGLDERRTLEISGLFSGVRLCPEVR